MGDPSQPPEPKKRYHGDVGIRASVGYAIEQCVRDWLDSIGRAPRAMETITGQARKWIYLKIGNDAQTA